MVRPWEQAAAWGPFFCSSSLHGLRGHAGLLCMAQLYTVSNGTLTQPSL